MPRRRRPHAGRRRLRGRPARLRVGRRPQDLEGGARPPCGERRQRRLPPPGRVPRPLLGRGAGRERHRRDLPARRQGEGRGHRHRQGLPGHDQAPPLPPRPEDARLAQHPQAGLDRRERHAVSCLQGHEDGGSDGCEARHAGRPLRSLGRRRAQPAARQGRRARSEERHRRDQRGSALDGCSESTASRWREEGRLARRGGLRRRGEAAPRARGRPRRAEREAPGHARGEVPRPRLRRPREAVAPEGHGPRPPGHDPRAAVHGRRRRVRAEPALVRGEGEQEGAEGGAPLGVERSRAGRHGGARRRVRHALDEAGRGAPDRLGQGHADARRRAARTRPRSRSRSATSTASP